MQKVYSLIVLVIIIAGCAACLDRTPKGGEVFAVGTNWNICFATKTKPDCPTGLFLPAIVVKRSSGTITFKSPTTEGSIEADESLVKLLDKEKRRVSVIVGD